MGHRTDDILRQWRTLEHVIIITQIMKIRIKKLHLRTYIGFNPEEKEKKQDVYIYVDINIPFLSSMQQEKIENIYNYKTITKKIIQYVENHHFLLLEKMTNDIADLVMKDEDVEEVTVEAEKPCALRFSEAVSVIIEKKRTHEPCNHFNRI